VCLAFHYFPFASRILFLPLPSWQTTSCFPHNQSKIRGIDCTSPHRLFLFFFSLPPFPLFPPASDEKFRRRERTRRVAFTPPPIRLSPSPPPRTQTGADGGHAWIIRDPAVPILFSPLKVTPLFLLFFSRPLSSPRRCGSARTHSSQRLKRCFRIPSGRFSPLVSLNFVFGRNKGRFGRFGKA